MRRDIKLNYTFYLPRFKQGYGSSGANLCNSLVTAKLAQLAITLRKRIRKLLLLEQIHQKRQLGNV